MSQQHERRAGDAVETRFQNTQRTITSKSIKSREASKGKSAQRRRQAEGTSESKKRKQTAGIGRLAASPEKATKSKMSSGWGILANPKPIKSSKALKRKQQRIED